MEVDVFVLKWGEDSHSEVGSVRGLAFFFWAREMTSMCRGDTFDEGRSRRLPAVLFQHSGPRPARDCRGAPLTNFRPSCRQECLRCVLIEPRT